MFPQNEILIRRITETESSAELQKYREVVKDLKEYWDYKKTVYKKDVNIEKRLKKQMKWEKIRQDYAYEVMLLKERFMTKFQKFESRLEIQCDKKLTNLMNSGDNSFIGDNLVISINANKMILLKITDEFEVFFPTALSDNILGFLSLSFVWSLFFERVGPWLAGKIRLLFKKNGLSNITMSGVHPVQFVNLIGEDGVFFKKYINLLKFVLTENNVLKFRC